MPAKPAVKLESFKKKMTTEKAATTTTTADHSRFHGEIEMGCQTRRWMSSPNVTAESVEPVYCHASELKGKIDDNVVLNS